MIDGKDVANLVNQLCSMVAHLPYVDCQVHEDDKVAMLLGALTLYYESYIVTKLEEKELSPTVVNSLQNEEMKLKRNEFWLKGRLPHHFLRPVTYKVL